MAKKETHELSLSTEDNLSVGGTSSASSDSVFSVSFNKFTKDVPSVNVISQTE